MAPKGSDRVMDYRAGFPNPVIDVEELMADGNWVARRFTFRGTHTGPFRGMPSSGRCIEVQGSVSTDSPTEA
jgi:predicted ester cyclase